MIIKIIETSIFANPPAAMTLIFERFEEAL